MRGYPSQHAMASFLKLVYLKAAFMERYWEMRMIGYCSPQSPEKCIHGSWLTRQWHKAALSQLEVDSTVLATDIVGAYLA